MRRLFTSLMAVSLIGSALGCCHHVGGQCDCDGTGDTCCYGHGPGHAVDPVMMHDSHSAPMPETIKVMPSGPGRGGEPPVIIDR